MDHNGSQWLFMTSQWAMTSQGGNHGNRVRHTVESLQNRRDIGQWRASQWFSIGMTSQWSSMDNDDVTRW